jgi:hypothetical protein
VSREWPSTRRLRSCACARRLRSAAAAAAAAAADRRRAAAAAASKLARPATSAAAAPRKDVCFANPGTTEMWLVSALDKTPGIRPCLGLHEAVCTGACDGYAVRARVARLGAAADEA